MKLDGFGLAGYIPESYVDPAKEAMKNQAPFGDLMTLFDSDAKSSIDEAMDVITGEFDHDDTFDSLMDVFTSYDDQLKELNEIDALV